MQKWQEAYSFLGSEQCLHSYTDFFKRVTQTWFLQVFINVSKLSLKQMQSLSLT
jgi:hypothetical protein